MDRPTRRVAANGRVVNPSDYMALTTEQFRQRYPSPIREETLPGNPRAQLEQERQRQRREQQLYCMNHRPFEGG